MVSTHLKNISQFGSSPQVGVKIKNICNHHPVSHSVVKPFSMSTHFLDPPCRYLPPFEVSVPSPFTAPSAMPCEPGSNDLSASQRCHPCRETKKTSYPSSHLTWKKKSSSQTSAFLAKKTGQNVQGKCFITICFWLLMNFFFTLFTTGFDTEPQVPSSMIRFDVWKSAKIWSGNY